MAHDGANGPSEGFEIAIHRIVVGGATDSVDEGPLAGTKWYLHTRDAHELYRRFGFGEPGERLMERPPGTGLGPAKSARSA